MPGESVVELLQHQLTGNLSLSDTVEQLSESDPQLGLLAQVLAKHQEQLQRDLERRELEELQRLEAARHLDERKERTDNLRRHLEEMEAELETIRSTLDELADALGACPSCWGEAADCRWCRGRGCPGFMPPNPESFDRLIMPAVRVQAHMRRYSDAYLDDHHGAESAPSHPDAQPSPNDRHGHGEERSPS